MIIKPQYTWKISMLTTIYYYQVISGTWYSILACLTTPDKDYLSIHQNVQLHSVRSVSTSSGLNGAAGSFVITAEAPAYDCS